MATLDFYNQNAHRHYPLQLGSTQMFTGVRLPYSILLDAGFILGFDMGNTNNVKLVSINKSGSDLIFRFEAIGYSSSPFLFQVNKDSVNGKRTDITIANGGMGYLVTGLLGDFYTALGNTNTAQGIYYVEPALIQCLKDTYVQSFTIVSGQRSIYVPPDGCSSTDAGDEYYITGSGIVGDVKFKEGYNAQIRILDSTTIEIGARVGYGSGKPCVELEADDGVLVEDVQFDGPECAQLLYSINGIKPVNGNVDIVSRMSGPVITTEVENNKVILDFTKVTDMSLCDLE